MNAIFILYNDISKYQLSIDSFWCTWVRLNLYFSVYCFDVCVPVAIYCFCFPVFIDTTEGTNKRTNERTDGQLFLILYTDWLILVYLSSSQSLFFCVLFCGSVFVLLSFFLVAIACSIVQFTAYDYRFGYTVLGIAVRRFVHSFVCSSQSNTQKNKDWDELKYTRMSQSRADISKCRYIVWRLRSSETHLIKQ
jgi:hypothetical protein